MKKYQLKSFSSPSNINYTDTLNSQQLKVVTEADGPSLVLAGAGSGKTRVLIHRLAYLLENGAAPSSILLVTFTNKAAAEMIHRAEVLMKSSLTGLWAGTFHHIGNITLRKEAQRLNYSPNFTIVDRSDAQDLIDDCIEELGYGNQAKLFPKKKVISDIQSLAINCQKDLDDVVSEFYPHLEEFLPFLKKVISRYKKKKQASNVMDFDDLLQRWLELLEDKEVCEKYSRQFKYILVDEYQDTNKLQFEILKKLSSFHKNILVVGDDAQSIYSFRGAEIHNLLDFPQIFEGTKIFKLEINYRSTPQVLSLANDIIKHNINQFPKELQAIKSGSDVPTVVKTRDVYQQAKFVAQRVLELNGEGVPLQEMAILFRSRFQALELEMELMKRNIPYVVRGGVRFFEQAHIKDTLAYLKVLINPQDELSFKRAICLHKGIGRGYAVKVWKKYVEEKKDYKTVIKELPKRQQEGAKDFFSCFNKIKQIESPQKAIKEIIASYKDYCYLSFDNPDERIQELEELAKMASDYPTIRRFLVEVGGYEEFKGETMLAGSDRNEILILSTIHQAKGLEWEAVFIIGMGDYEFPHPKALNGEGNIEEERRLFYVATTRAKSLLHVSYPETKYTFKNGVIINKPSMFLNELSRRSYEEMAVEEEFSY